VRRATRRGRGGASEPSPVTYPISNDQFYCLLRLCRRRTHPDVRKNKIRHRLLSDWPIESSKSCEVCSGAGNAAPTDRTRQRVRRVAAWVDPALGPQFDSRSELFNERKIAL
jgi:hypothetical protein